MIETTKPAAPHEHVPSGPLFWGCAAVGAAVIGYGLLGAWTDRADTHPVELAGWLAGAGLVHDAALAPLIVLVAWASGRLPAPLRFPARLALALSALLTLMFWPMVQGWGRQPSVPSALPLDYGRNLVVVVAAIWAVVFSVAGLVAAVQRRRARR